MEIILKTGFASITNNIKFWPEPKKNGKNLILSGHVYDVKEEVLFKDVKILSAKCIRINNKYVTYNFQVHVSQNLLHFFFISFL